MIPTRTTDVFMSVGEKAKFANENHGDLFVCIHADAVDIKNRFKNYRVSKPKLTIHKIYGKGKHRKKIVTTHTREVPLKNIIKFRPHEKERALLSWPLVNLMIK